MRVVRLLRMSLGGIAVAGLVGALFGASSVASTGPPALSPTCAGLTKAPVVYRAGRVVVYRDAVRGDGGAHDWACSSHPASAFATGLGIGSGGGFAPGAVVGDFGSDGVWLVDLATSKRGWSSCDQSASTQPCRRDHHEVELTDTYGGAGTSTTSAAHVEIHLSTLPEHHGHRTAAAVWTQPAKGSLITLKAITVREGQGFVAFGPNPPVTGKIDPRSVTVHGLSVSFTENGRPRTISLGV